MPYLTRDMLGLKKGDEVKIGTEYRNETVVPDYPNNHLLRPVYNKLTAVDIALMLEVGMLTEEKPLITTEDLKAEVKDEWEETPWKPKIGEEYWLIRISDYDGIVVRDFIWQGGNSTEEVYYKSNLIFPTESAALAKAEEIRKVLKK